ncbi:hypothetical protein LTR53_009020 [Teratosphaeriaceae sp. CCFEE 6253]|nr:hypothetical protein LTR53_009020 [Teratosphaeriaceae sp. CCFEE 6253]
MWPLLVLLCLLAGSVNFGPVTSQDAGLRRLPRPVDSLSGFKVVVKTITLISGDSDNVSSVQRDAGGTVPYTSTTYSYDPASSSVVASDAPNGSATLSSSTQVGLQSSKVAQSSSASASTFLAGVPSPKPPASDFSPSAIQERTTSSDMSSSQTSGTQKPSTGGTQPTLALSATSSTSTTANPQTLTDSTQTTSLPATNAESFSTTHSESSVVLETSSLSGPLSKGSSSTISFVVLPTTNSQGIIPTSSGIQPSPTHLTTSSNASTTAVPPASNNGTQTTSRPAPSIEPSSITNLATSSPSTPSKGSSSATSFAILPTTNPQRINPTTSGVEPNSVSSATSPNTSTTTVLQASNNATQTTSLLPAKSGGTSSTTGSGGSAVQETILPGPPSTGSSSATSLAGSPATTSEGTVPTSSGTQPNPVLSTTSTNTSTTTPLQASSDGTNTTSLLPATSVETSSTAGSEGSAVLDTILSGPPLTGFSSTTSFAGLPATNSQGDVPTMGPSGASPSPTPDSATLSATSSGSSAVPGGISNGLQPATSSSSSSLFTGLVVTTTTDGGSVYMGTIMPQPSFPAPTTLEVYTTFPPQLTWYTTSTSAVHNTHDSQGHPVLAGWPSCFFCPPSLHLVGIVLHLLPGIYPPTIKCVRTDMESLLCPNTTLIMPQASSRIPETLPETDHPAGWYTGVSSS